MYANSDMGTGCVDLSLRCPVLLEQSVMRYSESVYFTWYKLMSWYILLVLQMQACDLKSVLGHDFATHMLLFWEGFSRDSQQAAGRIFASSALANTLVIVQPEEITNAPHVIAQLGFGQTKQSEVITEGIKVCNLLLKDHILTRAAWIIAPVLRMT